jgi:hypothetical protein
MYYADAQLFVRTTMARVTSEICLSVNTTRCFEEACISVAILS